MPRHGPQVEQPRHAEALPQAELLQADPAVFVLFAVEGAQQEVAAMKEGVGLLVDVDQLAADGAGAELGHGSGPPAALQRRLGVVLPGHARQRTVHLEGLDVLRRQCQGLPQALQ